MRFLSRAGLALLLLTATAVTSHAHTAKYMAILSGVDVEPSNASPGSGIAFVTMDLDLITMRVQVSFSGLTGTVTAANLHAPTAIPLTGTAGIASQTPNFFSFPTGVTSGSYDQTFDLTVAESYNPAFITSSGGTVSDALNALDFAVEEGRSYINIRTSAFPQGEIRGFLVAAAPEPASIGLLSLGGIALVIRRRRR